MSISVSLDELNDDQLTLVEEKCVVKNKEHESIPIFSTKATTAYIPLGMWDNFAQSFPLREWDEVWFDYGKQPYTKKTDPKGYRDQDVVIKKSLEILKEKHVVFLSLPCGFGKTTIGCYLSSFLGLRTVVLCHSSIVNEQWHEEFLNNGTASVERVRKDRLDLDCDVHIMGILKASKMSRKQFKNVGLVILDEAHICSITAFTKSLLLFQPKYLIALSATPERSDGMHKIFKTYFKNSMIKRKELKQFTVYKYNTGIKPLVKYIMYKGRYVPHWTVLKNSLAYNIERQKMIVDVARKQTEKTMILSDRDEECNNIYNALYKMYCDDEIQMRPYLFTKRAPKPPEDCNMIVAAIKKAGVGFDDPELKVLIIVTDFKDVRQFEGRLRTVNSTVYDFVDYFQTLENHWKGRERWYKAKGANVIHKHIKRSINSPEEGSSSSGGATRFL